MQTGIGMDLLSWGPRVGWLIAYVFVAAAHTNHVIFMRGQARAWHCTHVLVAAGMIYMFGPWSGDPLPANGWQKVFESVAVVIAVFVVVEWARNRAVNLLWFSQLFSMGAMAYMFALMGGTSSPLDHAITRALVAIFVLEAAGWSRRQFAEADDARLSWIPFSVHPRPARAVCASRLCGRLPVDLALSGTIMTLGMAWMFLAMDTPATDWISRSARSGYPLERGTAIAAAVVGTVLVLPLRIPRRQTS